MWQVCVPVKEIEKRLKRIVRIMDELLVSIFNNQRAVCHKSISALCAKCCFERWGWISSTTWGGFLCKWWTSTGEAFEARHRVFGTVLANRRPTRKNLNRVELPREGGSNGEKKGEVRLQDRLQALRWSTLTDGQLHWHWRWLWYIVDSIRLVHSWKQW